MRLLTALGIFAAAATLSALLAPAHARADASLSSSAFTQVPSRFNTHELTLGSRGLGETCYSRGVLPDGTVCNPAYLDEAPPGFLMGRIFLGNGYTALSTANSLLFQPLTRDFLQGLFQNNVTSLETNVSLVFQAKYFSASFSPYRVQYFSEVHNPNYPVIAVHAAVERALTFSGGSSLEVVNPALKDFSAGAKLRILDRNYIHGSFSMSETLTQNPSDLLPVKEQFAAYFDPTLAWRPSRAPWKLRGSVGLVNVGKTSNNDPLYQEPIDAVAGVGVEPPVGFGHLRLGMDAVGLAHADGLASMLRLGTSYQLGIMEAMGGWNENAVTGGIQFGFQVLQAGIVYEFVRSEIEGGSSEKRISTEISIRL
jgi:hypothetical protein